MVTETRHLIFQNHEVHRALADFQKHRGDPLPPGTIAGITLGRTPKIHCILEWDADEASERQSRLFQADELGAALIRYCIGKKIPLPAKSPKVLQIFNGQIGLVISINLSEDALRRLQASN